METRVALISIIVENNDVIDDINRFLHEAGKYIIGRMGIPYREKGINIISIAIDAPQDVISSLSGKIGHLSGVSAKIGIFQCDHKAEDRKCKVAVYGKGGIGKSTTVSNVAVALAEKE